MYSVWEPEKDGRLTFSAIADEIQCYTNKTKSLAFKCFSSIKKILSPTFKMMCEQSKQYNIHYDIISSSVQMCCLILMKS